MAHEITRAVEETLLPSIPELQTGRTTQRVLEQLTQLTGQCALDALDACKASGPDANKAQGLASQLIALRFPLNAPPLEVFRELSNVLVDLYAQSKGNRGSCETLRATRWLHQLLSLTLRPDQISTRSPQLRIKAQSSADSINRVLLSAALRGLGGMIQTDNALPAECRDAAIQLTRRHRNLTASPEMLGATIPQTFQWRCERAAAVNRSIRVELSRADTAALE
ncbi:MAG: hypothetical protein ACKVPX_01320 [Myxococcaceae bacterium]